MFPTVKDSFKKWCAALGYHGELFFHGSTMYGMVLDTSDVDVIFDSRSDLSRLVWRYRRSPARYPTFEVFEDGTWFSRKNSTCRVQFMYKRRDHNSGITVDACARDKGEADLKVAYMQRSFNATLEQELGLNIKRWWSVCKHYLSDIHPSAKPNSYKIALLVLAYLNTKNPDLLQDFKDDPTTEYYLRLGFYDFLTHPSRFDYESETDPITEKPLFTSVPAHAWKRIRKLAREESELLKWYGYGLDNYRFDPPEPIATFFGSSYEYYDAKAKRR